ALDVAWMDGLADILHGRIAEDCSLARFWVDLDIDDMRGKAAADAGWIDSSPANDETARSLKLLSELLERQALRRVVLATQDTIFVGNRFGLHFPDLRAATDHLRLDVLSGFVSGPSGGEGDAAASGHVGVADHVGVRDHRLHVLSANPQRLGQLHGDGRARAADVGRALDKAYRPIGVD